MDKLKKQLPLWLPYAALSGWLMCFMRVCFRSVERMGLIDQENTLFIALCAGIVLGMVIPLPDLRAKWRKNQTLFRICALAAALCTVMAVNMQGAAALILALLASFFASCALGCSLYRISLQLNRKSFGLFFGAAFSSSEGLLFVLLLLRYDRFPAAFPASIIGLCLLLFVAAAAYRDDETPESHDKPELEAPPLSRSLMLKYLLAISLYCVMGGMLDNLTTFDDAFIGVPHLLEYVYLFSVVTQLVLGKVFHRFNWHRLAMAGILLICAGQIAPYFASISSLAVPYLALTTLGIIIMEFLVRSLPTQFAAGTRRKALVARLGYMALYGGFMVTSILFEYLPRGHYFFVMGIIMMLALAILMLMYVTFGKYEVERAVAKFKKEDVARVTSLDKYGLTPRENEICLLILQGQSERQIAVNLHITEATVRFHRKSLYKKMNVAGRPELFAIFMGDIQFKKEKELVSTSNERK